MKLSYLAMMRTDPSYNLAMEQYVFDCLPRDRMYFMLWQNDNAIIVGKYQNTFLTILRSFCEHQECARNATHTRSSLDNLQSRTQHVTGRVLCTCDFTVGIAGFNHQAGKKQRIFY